VEWSRLVPELTVSDFAESIRFYTDVLGFEVMFSRTDDVDFAYLDFEGSQLMLEEFHTDGWNVARLEKPYGRGINLQIECSNADEPRDGLSSAKYPLYREMEDVWRVTGDTVTGSRESLVQDPDGYLLRFCEHLGESDQTGSPATN
jgi:catechol 2,3-dioxygenase-like lactoylglutathione lyase family enzyme